MSQPEVNMAELAIMASNKKLFILKCDYLSTMLNIRNCVDRMKRLDFIRINTTYCMSQNIVTY